MRWLMMRAGNTVGAITLDGSVYGFTGCNVPPDTEYAITAYHWTPTATTTSR